MKNHEKYAELLPFYASGTLEREQARIIEAHLQGCVQCQADLALWKAVSTEVVTQNQSLSPSPGVVERTLAISQSRESPRRSLAAAFRHSWLILRMQVPLVRREIWPASTLVTILGFIAALLMERTLFAQVLAPLVAATCMASLYGTENDSALELTLATTTSSWQILLARMTLVFGYNLVLALIASLGLLTIIPLELLGDLILGWLGPMAFLSSLALLLSMFTSTGNAIAISYLAWMGRWFGNIEELIPLQSARLVHFWGIYNQFWESSFLLLILAAALTIAGLWMADKSKQSFFSPLTSSG